MEMKKPPHPGKKLIGDNLDQLGMGSATSSRYPSAAPTIVCSIAAVTKRHGGSQSRSIRSQLPRS
jgi:hypothetical protein